MKKKLILVAAPPACGKTYVSEMISRSVEHIVYLDKDDLAHHVGVLSVDKNADLMNPESRTMSELFYPEDIDPRQCIEGNIVETPRGVINLLRTMKSGISLEMTVDISNPEKPMYNRRLFLLR